MRNEQARKNVCGEEISNDARGGLIMDNESSLMEPLQLAGRLIMENGGEIHRVEDTILRMGEAFHLNEVDCFAVPSGFFISFRKQDGTTESVVTRVRRGETNLQKVDAVNAVSRHLAGGQLAPDMVMNELQRICDSASPYTQWQVAIGAAVSAVGFALIFGGHAVECLMAAAAAVIGQMAVMLINRAHIHTLFAVIAGSFMTVLVTGLCSTYLFPFGTETAIAGALMPFVPGLAMTNAVADLIRGDMLSGVSHGFSAILTAGMIAAGTIAGNGVLTLIGGGTI